MGTETIKPLKYAAQMAFIYAVFILLLQVLMPMIGIHTDRNQQIDGGKQLLVYGLNYIPFLGMIYLVQQKYTDVNQRFVYYQRFSAGFTVVGFAAIFSGILLLIYYNYFSHELFENMRKTALENVINDPVKLQNAKKMFRFIPFFYLFGNMFWTLFSGIILSLLSATLIKNKP